MSIAVKLPALGESVVEGTVSRWLVREGEAVEVDQPLCEVTTDKVDAEIPSPRAGVIERILVAEGATVDVGVELALIGTEAVTDDDAGDASDSAVVRAVAESMVRDTANGATPVARRLAEQADVPLAEIHGTGAAGRITKSDVLSHRESASHSSAATQPALPAKPAQVVATETPPFLGLQLELEEGDRVVPMTAQRRLIAAHMVYSKRTSPHVGTVAEVDMSGVASFRSRHAQAFQDRHGTSLTYLPFVAHAAAQALREFPALNASVADDALVLRHGIHLALAVETEKGLLAPVVRDADSLSLTGLALAIGDLSLRARTKRLGPDDLRGGTFTISNPGRKGNLYGFAIINQPQVGILRMGELVKRPVVRSVDGTDAIAIRPLMHLALSYDHRAVDGSPANAFLFRIRELLEAAAYEL